MKRTGTGKTTWSSEKQFVNERTLWETQVWPVRVEAWKLGSNEIPVYFPGFQQTELNTSIAER